MNVKLEPWTVPAYVRAVQPPGKRQDGLNPNPLHWKLKFVDEQTLAQQCDRFRDDVFRKAGKVDPATTGKKSLDK